MNAVTSLDASDPRSILLARLEALETVARRLRWAHRGFEPELIDRVADVLTAARVLFGEPKFLMITRDVLLHLASRRIVLDPAPVAIASRSTAIAPFTRLAAQATAMCDRVLAELERLAALMTSPQLEEIVLSIAAAYELNLPEAPGRAA